MSSRKTVRVPPGLELAKSAPQADSPSRYRRDRLAPGIGDRVAKRRIDAGLTARELARRAGVAPSTVTRTENGAGLPRLDEAIRITWALRTSLDWMVFGALSAEEERELRAARVLLQAARGGTKKR